MSARVRARITEYQDQLQPFLNIDVTLVPIPRSSPIKKGQLWPSLEIANMIAGFGYGTVATCLERQRPVKKLAFCSSADERPSVVEHYESFDVKGMVLTEHITLVDDILTQGRTGLAAASRLADKFPGATIRLFCLMRAKGLEKDKEIDKILNVRVETMTYNSNTGRIRINS